MSAVTLSGLLQVFQPDRRSEQQQIDDLLDEIGDEVNIDNYGASGTTTSSGKTLMYQTWSAKLQSVDLVPLFSDQAPAVT